MEINLGLGEGAPAHIGVAAARRHGPTFAIELSRFFEVAYTWPMQLAAWRRVLSLAIRIGHPRDQAHSPESPEECLSPWVKSSGASAQRPGSPSQSYRRRPDSEQADLRQLRRLKWRSARAVGGIYIYIYIYMCVYIIIYIYIYIFIFIYIYIRFLLCFFCKFKSAIFCKFDCDSEFFLRKFEI